MGYTYKGNDADAKPALGRPPRPFDPAACGTERGVQQHRRAGESGCALCREFYNAKRRARRAA